MRKWHAIALFCDDIREEKTGQDTIVGIFPDNVSVPTIPGAFAKLAIYARINIDPSATIDSITVVLRGSDGQEHDIGRFNRDFLDKQREDNKKTGAPLIGLISRSVASPVAIQKRGRMVVLIRADNEEEVCGSLNVQLSPS